MLNIGGWEVLVIFLVALIVLGPERLPDAAKQAGKFFREVRKISGGFQRELNEAMRDPISAAGLNDLSDSDSPKRDVSVDAAVPRDPSDPFAAKNISAGFPKAKSASMAGATDPAENSADEDQPAEQPSADDSTGAVDESSEGPDGHDGRDGAANADDMARAERATKLIGGEGTGNGEGENARPLPPMPSDR